MTPTDLRIKFKLKTGINAIEKVNSKNRHIYLNDRYIKWLEGNNNKLRELFKRDMGLTATFGFYERDDYGEINKTIRYRDTYKLWLEDYHLQWKKFSQKLKENESH
jgi:hypothetical protein